MTDAQAKELALTTSMIWIDDETSVNPRHIEFMKRHNRTVSISLASGECFTSQFDSDKAAKDYQHNMVKQIRNAAKGVYDR